MDLIGVLLWARKRKWIGYTIAALGCVIGIGTRILLGGAFTGFPFITFFPAILLAVIAGGRGAGYVATFGSAVLATYLIFTTPVLAAHGPSFPWVEALLGLTAFGLVTMVLILLIDFTMETSARLDRTSQALQTANDELEARVAARTRELTALTRQLKEEIRDKETAETHLRQMQKMEAVGQLTAGIAHDFNNMLTVVIGSLDAARRRVAEGERATILKYIDHAAKGAQRAAELTRRLLVFSRKQDLDPTAFDANRLVGGMSDLLRRTIGETVTLEIALAGRLWPAFADAAQLESALLNLVVNARDAMPNGGRVIIETSNAELDELYTDANIEVVAGEYVLISVTDTGTGMAPEVVAHAFDPFYSTKSAGEGTGLGLSQVLGFIKQSGGHVKIYTEQGHGTTVKLHLPRHAGVLAAAEVPRTATLPHGDPGELILVVEDDPQVLRLSVDSLRDLGYSVVHSDNPIKALEQLEELPNVRLLFTDVVMPGMNGHELAQKALAQRSDIKVLYTTGYARRAFAGDGQLDPDAEFLTKPFTLAQLAEKVRHVLDRPGTVSGVIQ